MKSLVRNFLVSLGAFIVTASCEQEEMPIKKIFDTNKPKLKSISNYYFEASEVPDEQFLFSYDQKGRIKSFDRYNRNSNGELVKELMFTFQYKVESSNPFYVVTVRYANNPDLIAGRRNVFLDSKLNYIRDIVYDGASEQILVDNIYSHYAGGFSVVSRKWIQAYSQYGITKIEHDTDANGNVIRKRIYNSHFENAEVEEFVETEYIMTHNLNANPLFNLTPYFSSINSSDRYPGSESSDNVASITAVGCENCGTTSFAYKYEGEFVSEVSPGGLNIYKRTFEYY